MQRECRETAVICCWERKDKWKNGEIVLAPFGNFLRKLNPGEDSLERVVIRRQKRRRRRRQRDATRLFLLFASSFVLYIHEIVVSSSLKEIRISCMVEITFPSIPRALCLERGVHPKSISLERFFDPRIL